MTRIAVSGLPFFGPQVARALREAGFAASYIPRPGSNPASWPRFLLAFGRSHAFYSIGSSAGRGSPNERLSKLGKKIIMHWVGSDVLSARHDHRLGLLSERLRTSAIHWADAPWLVGELEEIGVRAIEHPLPVPIATGEAQPLPPHFKVLVYLPRGEHPAHHIAATLSVIRSLPDIAFLAVGGRADLPGLPNLEVRGFVDEMAPVYLECSVILRLTGHDGLSHSIVEALSFGRHAVWTFDLPGVTHVQNAEEAAAALRSLANEAANGTLSVNANGARAVTERYSEPTIARELTEAMRQALSGGDTGHQ